MIRRLIRALIALIVAVPLLSACDPTQPLDPTVIDAFDRVGNPAVEDPETHVNSLVYTYRDPASAMEAYRWVADARGWSEADREAWAPFVQAVIGRESGYCWNVRRGARIAQAEGCVLKWQGEGSDSGYGQVLGGYPNKPGWYRPTDGGIWRLHENAVWLCPQEGLCSPNEIVASPWSSMVAFVATLERSGRQPWCWTTRLRRGAVCRLAP